MDPQAPMKEDESRLKLNIKFSGRTIPVEIAASSTIKDLKSLLQTLTNVLPRGQKLIFKGKVLSDGLTFASSEISDGSKIMLMASQGLHQGDGPIRKEAVVLPGARGVTGVSREKKEKTKESVTKSQLDRWRATGVIALSDCGLLTIPEEVWSCGPSARVFDVSHNSLLEVPSTIGCLSSTQKLLLNGNHLSEKSIGWEGLTSLKSLMVLSLNQNNLAAFPSALGALTCLKQLHIESNKLTSIPTEIGFLTKLEVLKAQNNRLKTIPASIGGCVSLVEVDFSCNLLVELPETFGNLKNLKALYLSNNGLKSLPGTLFKMCLQLSILDLHGTEITMDLLRQVHNISFGRNLFIWFLGMITFDPRFVVMNAPPESLIKGFLGQLVWQDIFPLCNHFSRGGLGLWQNGIGAAPYWCPEAGPMCEVLKDARFEVGSTSHKSVSGWWGKL